MSRPIRSFVTLLGILSRGRLVEKLDEKLAETLAALKVHPNNKAKGKITLELALEYNDGRIEIVPTVKNKLPEEKGLGGTPRKWTFWPRAMSPCAMRAETRTHPKIQQERKS